MDSGVGAHAADSTTKATGSGPSAGVSLGGVIELTTPSKAACAGTSAPANTATGAGSGVESGVGSSPVIVSCSDYEALSKKTAPAPLVAAAAVVAAATVPLDWAHGRVVNVLLKRQSHYLSEMECMEISKRIERDGAMNGMLVCGDVGVWGCWGVGKLVCEDAGVWGCWGVGMLVCGDAGV